MLGDHHVCLCHADHNSQSFCFVFLFNIKIPVLVILVTEKKKKRRRNSKFLSACGFEKNNVDGFVGTYIWQFTYGIYTDGEQTRTKGQFGHGELTSLRLSSLRGKGTAGLTAGLGRQSSGSERHGRASGLF